MVLNISATVNDKTCTGCGACFAACPFGAITISTNNDGFLIPYIDVNKCTNCGKCLQVCSAKNFKTDNNETPDCYAVIGNENIRRISSSGGVFSFLADYVFSKGGCVCGAAFTKDWNVHHIIIEDEKDLDKLRRSKYLQSEIGDIFNRIKNILDDNRWVLFSGTPCQVSGLKNFLAKDYEKLILVDVVCHGIPPYSVFRKFLEEKVPDINEIKNINFRDKECAGIHMLFSINTDKSKIVDQNYFNGFVNNLYLRNSCASCNYTKLQRQGDITIGDFWGIAEHDMNFWDEKGTSIVLVNNEKGKFIFEQIQNKFAKCGKFPLSIISKDYLSSLFRPPIPHTKRDLFFDLIKKRSFKDSLALTLGGKYDVGVVGCGFANNYGAILTNYALYQTIKTFNLRPLVIDKPLQLTNVVYNANIYLNTEARSFMNKYMEISDIYKDSDDLRKLNNICNTFLVGSDQVWRAGSNASMEYFYFLNWAADYKKKISYASSFGTNYFDYKDDVISNIKYFLNRFDKISVREDSGIDICKNVFGIDAVQNIDPIFFRKTEDWQDLIKNSDYELPNEKYIASYLLDANQTNLDILKYAENKLNMNSYIFKDLTDDKVIYDKSLNVLENASCETFLKVFKNSKFIVTNSYHGVCFSIIFNKPFICIPNKLRGYTRFLSLLKQFNLQDRMVDSLEELKEKSYLLEPFDYSNINQIIEEKRTKSLTWLKDALFEPKKISRHLLIILMS